MCTYICTIKLQLGCALCAKIMCSIMLHFSFALLSFLQAFHSMPNTGSGWPPFCVQCNKTFSNNHSLKEHLKMLHQGIYRYRCQYCGRGFSAKQFLQGHLASHTGVREFKCHMCDKAFSYKHNLNTHLKMHSVIGQRENKSNDNV